MKKILSAALSLAVVFAFATPTIVAAQDKPATDPSTKTQTQRQTAQDTSTKVEDTNSADDTDDAVDDSKNRTTRIGEYKKRFSEKLTQAQQKKITNVCKASQGKVTSASNNLKNAVERRKGHYQTISTKIDDLIVKLEAASIEATELKAAKTEIDAKAAKIAQAATEYETALSDLSTMDCATDPTGFKAALTVAREKRAALLSEVQALKEYVNTTVKDLLKSVRTQLENNTSDDNS